MVRIDGRKIGEVKDYYNSLAESEIQSAKNAGTELKEDDITAIRNKYTFKCVESLQHILSAGPEKLFKNGFALESNGWREGYTKSPIKKRAEKRRKKNKAARIARRNQRKK